LHSTLPLEEIEARLRAGTLPVRGSGNAGRYLCNAVMYLALSATARRDPPPPCGFIHLPFCRNRPARMHRCRWKPWSRLSGSPSRRPWKAV